MIEKVKLPRDVAEVIERYRGLGCTNEGFVHDHIKSGIYHAQDAALSGFNLDTLIRALYIGYEVEEIPEDMLLRYYENLAEKYNGQIAIKAALNILGIKVKGVNDHG